MRVNRVRIYPVRMLGAAALVLGVAAQAHVAGVGPVALAGPAGLHVQGNRLVGASGATVQLHGVDRSGTEYACLSGPNFADGPTDAASVQAMAAWHVNAVRVPLNEDCWLGINGAAIGGSAYQQDIANWVQTLTQNGMYVILDLHWSAPGGTKADRQVAMPDADHAPAFWSGVANAFKGNQDVLFDLFNEPFPDNKGITDTAFRCVRDGGSACPGLTYQAAGLQTLLNAVRATGAQNVVMQAGVNYASALGLPGAGTPQWLTYKLNDPLNNLAASWHAYNYSACSSLSCWIGSIAAVAAQVPVIVGETGDTDCTSSYIGVLPSWLDQHGIGYLAWNWGADFGCQSLVTAYSGAPRQPYGQTYWQHLVGLSTQAAPGSGSFMPAAGTPVASPTSTSTPAPSAPSTIVPAPSATASSTPGASATSSSTPAASATPIGTKVAAGAVSVTSPLQLSAASVGPGGTLTGTATLTNNGSGAVNLSNAVIAIRAPGGTNSGGPYYLLGQTGPVSLGAGQSLQLQQSRTFSTGDPTGAWYGYVTYQTTDGVWHDSPVNVSFSMDPSAAIAFSSPVQLSAQSVALGGTLTGVATLRNTGGSPITLRDIVIAGRPPNGTNKGGPFLDFGGTESVTLSPGQSLQVQKARTFTASDPTGAWYSYVTYETTDGVWHDSPVSANFSVTR